MLRHFAQRMIRKASEARRWWRALECLDYRHNLCRFRRLTASDRPTAIALPGILNYINNNF
jgi:hypothetical protein